MRRGGLVVVATAGLLVLPGWPAEAQSCQPGAESDFDGDGVTDIAIADPDATVGSHDRAGRVHVVFGDGSGSQTISQADSFVSGGPEAGDRFGFSLASVDYNEDGCSDLVVGAPFEAVGDEAEAGWADVLYGSPTGFGPNGHLLFSQDSAGMPGGTEPGDRFAFDLAAGITTGDERFLVFGVPGEDLGASTVDAGAINYVRGSIMFLTHQGKSGVFGGLEAGDQYGYAIAASPRHIAVGGPGEALGGYGYSGTVGVFTHDVVAGTVDGWDQDQPGDSGVPEAGDSCGRSLAMADYIPPGGSASDVSSLLAVGCPGETVGPTASAGRVVIINVDGSLAELASVQQDAAGMADVVEPSDYFGWSVHMANRRPDAAVTWRDLLVAAGVPGEDNNLAYDNGRAQLFSAVGPPGDRDVWAHDGGMVDAGWDQTTRARTSQYLGGSSTHLYVADPYGPTPAVYAVPWQNLTDGASDPVRVYRPGDDGLPTSGVGTFGGAVA